MVVPAAAKDRAMDNIDRFNDITARAFAELYEHFPCRRNLELARLAGLDAAQVELDFPMVPPEFDFAGECVRWLADAGYLWIDGDGGQLHVEARLAPKALEVLNASPAALDRSVSIGDGLRAALREGAFEAARELVKAAFGLGVKMLAT